jgi:hypothetical protein
VDKDEALQVAADKAAVLRTWSYGELSAKLLGAQETTEATAASGVVYQLEVAAHREGDDLGVSVLVDDGGWRALAPLGVDFIMAPDGTFIDD